MEINNGTYQQTEQKQRENIAYQKPTRSNFSKNDTHKVTDGDRTSCWEGVLFPSYVDIDLMDAYAIDTIKLYFPQGKNIYYTIYGSNDGRDFDRIYTRHEDLIATDDGEEIVFEEVQNYRIVRVYLEYTKDDATAYLSEVEVFGTKSNTNTEALRTGSLEEILDMKDFDDTEYAKPITTEETIENVYGIIDRILGDQYRSWFSFEVKPNAVNDKDYFEVSNLDGKIHIVGNQGLSLTTGLNYYFKNYLKVHVSEQTKQVKMPASLVEVQGTVRKETECTIRYAFNYCTLSYSFAFFGEEEWQRENDWLALNGVNVVMDLAGQEATWIKFLMNFGYSFDDAKDWLTGPSYYAWQFMDNIEAFGGPIPDGYVFDRVELARSTQRWKRSLGMHTIMQGYAGMVPTNFNEYQPNVATIDQGTWGGIARPSMIATDSSIYDEYAEKFYEAQRFVYGSGSHYYAVDPFHEGGIRPEGLSDATISLEVLESMLKYDPEATWVVQGWQDNPTNGLLSGMGEYRNNHVLIVDLIKYPINPWTKYNRTRYGSTRLDSVEFNGTNWAWGLLANFGGNPSMHGEMETMVNDILNARKTCKHMCGIGIISEAMHDNPVMYDLIFDLAWADDTFDLDQWLDAYVERRYGGYSENAQKAWDIMKDANYNYGVRYTTEVFGMKCTTPQSYKKQSVSYDAQKLQKALGLLLADFEQFKDSECYRYDLTEIMRQQVSNYAVYAYNDLLAGKNSNNIEKFKQWKANFLNAFDVLNEVAATQREQLGGEWIGKAYDRSAHYDDFSRDIFALNAKTLITTWGSTNTHHSLKDYGWRNYEGIFLDVYKTIWIEYLDRVEANLVTGAELNNKTVDQYFDLYWQWVLAEQNYTRIPRDSASEIKAVSDRVVDECTIAGGTDPNIGNIALDGVAHGEGCGTARDMNDGAVDTVFIAEGAEHPTVVIDLLGEFALHKINVLTDSGKNQYYHYEVFVRDSETEWVKIGEKTSDEVEAQQGTSMAVNHLNARYVKIVGTFDSLNSGKASLQLALSEVRVYGERILPYLSQLKTLVDFAESLDLTGNGEDMIFNMHASLKEARAAVLHEAAPDEVNCVYWNLYERLTKLELTYPVEF